MGFRMIGHLVTDARSENKYAAVCKLCLQFTLQTKQDVTLVAPVVGQIVGRVFKPSEHGSRQIAASATRQCPNRRDESWTLSSPNRSVRKEYLPSA